MKAGLQDTNNVELTGGTVRFHQLGWQDFGDANTQVRELFPGRYTFEMTYNNGRQTFSNHDVPAVAAHTVLFTTVSVTPALETAAGATLSGGTVRFHQLGWQNWGSANEMQELLPGSYTFEMTYNNGRQTFSNYDVPAGSSHEVLFTTAAVTPALKDAAGASLDNGTVRFHQLGWQDFGAANTSKELLPGRYTFEMTYNNGRQTFSNYTITAAPTQEVLFTTTTTHVRLATCADAGLAGGSVQFHQIGWQPYGTTGSSGNVTLELLPGSYTFQMTYNNGRQTFSNYAVPGTGPHTVTFATAAATFGYAGTVQFHQLGWQTFAQPTMQLLPGNYTFKFVEANLTVSNVAVGGCSFGGDLTVDFPGISSVHTYVKRSDGVAGVANGTQVDARTYKNDQAVFETLPNGVYDVVVKKGAMTLIVDNVVVLGSTVVNDIVADLTVDFPGISSVHTYVKVDDGTPNAAGGGDVDSRTYKNDGASLVVLKGAYDVTVRKGAMTYYADAVDCTTGTCAVTGIVKTLTVAFPGISSVHTYVKVDDGNPAAAAGGDVDNRTYKTDGTSLVVLQGAYDVLVRKGAMTYVAQAVDCSAAGACLVDNIVAMLAVEFPGISSVHTYVKVDDGNAGTAAGGDVDNRTYKNDGTSLAVLKGTYDVMVRKGAMTYYADAVDCTTNTCTVTDIVQTLTVNFPGISSVHTYVKVDDGSAGTAAGGDVDSRTYKNNSMSLTVLKGMYDVTVRKGAQTYYADAVDCTAASSCLVDNIVATLTVEFPGYSSVHVYVKQNDNTAGTAAGGDVDSRTYQNNSTTIPVLKAFYDVVIKIGSHTGIVDAVDCTGSTCTLNGGSLTVHAPNGTRVDIRSADGATVIASVSNVGSDKVHVFTNLPIGIYDIHLVQGAATTIVNDLFFLTSQALDALVRWTVYAPNGTAVQVRVPGTADVVTSVSDVGSDKVQVLEVIPNTYDLYLKQGAAEKTLPNVAATADFATDELCQLTVYAPNGTRVEVRTQGGDATQVVTSVSDVGSDKVQVFDVIKGTYDLFLKQGAGEKTLTGAEAVDCSGETQTVDQLVQWTVFAPNGTAVQVLTQNGSGVVTSVSNVGSDKREVFDVVPNTYDLFLNQGAGIRTVEDTAVLDNVSTDELCQLTVYAPNGTAAEVQTTTSGALTGVSNVGSDKVQVFDVIKGTWNLFLQQGAGAKTVANLDCTGETHSTDQLVQWTVYAPNGTEVKVYTPDRSGVVTGVSDVGSDKQQVLDVVPNVYDLYLKQGAQESWLDDVDASANRSDDQLCQLQVFAPNGSAIDVRTADAALGLVTGVSNVGSDHQHVFDVVKGVYNVFHGVVVHPVDCSGETAATTFTGSSSVSGSGTLEATYGSPTVTFNAAVSAGTFDINYPTGTGHARAGVAVSGSLVCMRIVGASAQLLGEVTASNSTEWAVGSFVSFGLQDGAPDGFNYSIGLATLPDCGTFSHTADLPLVAGDYAITP
ncbi:MAG: hypothetical protein KC425_25715 [Anaerolineales bacterium]|nr:hypothetical protein [Anaerolineales bacterium]